MNAGFLQPSTCEMRINLEVWKKGSVSVLSTGPLADNTEWMAYFP